MNMSCRMRKAVRGGSPSQAMTLFGTQTALAARWDGLIQRLTISKSGLLLEDPNQDLTESPR